MANSTYISKRPHHSGAKSRGPSGINIRSPSLELFGLKHARSLGIGKAYPLNADELKIARFVFGSAIDYKPVRILKTSAVHSPTVVGNTIRTDIQSPFLGCRATFVHEMAHVWQYQTGGTRYMSNSLYQQLKEKVTSEDMSFKIAPNASIYQFTAEQQADIVSDFYVFTVYEKTVADLERKGKLLRNKKGEIAVLPVLEAAGLVSVDEAVIARVQKYKKEYGRMIEQVRRSRPLPRKLREDLILKETTWNEGVTKPPSERRVAQPNPLIRIEF